MDFHPLTGRYQPPYNNASMQERTWPYTHALNPHQYASTQGSPQSMNDDLSLPPDHYQTFCNPNSTQIYLHPFGPHYSYEDPIPPVDIVVVDPYGGRVYDPSLDQHHQNNSLPPSLSQEEIPQCRYECGNTQKRDEKLPIYFSKNGYPGMKLVDALESRFEDLDNRDSFPIEGDCSAITIRTHFPGYLSSTEVDRALKALGRPRARSMQVSTKDYRAERRPVTKERLVREVSKRIQWYIDDLLKHHDLFPFDERVGEKWRLGQGLKFEHMEITSLDNVSNGSWSPVIRVDRH